MQANEGDGSFPRDRYNHVFDLMRNGNHAFRDSRFEHVRFWLLMQSTVFYFCWPSSHYQINASVIVLISFENSNRYEKLFMESSTLECQIKCSSFLVRA